MHCRLAVDGTEVNFYLKIKICPQCLVPASRRAKKSHRVTIFRSLPEQAWILERDALEAGPELVALIVTRDADLAELAGISVLGAVAPVARTFSVAGANQT